MDRDKSIKEPKFLRIYYEMERVLGIMRRFVLNRKEDETGVSGIGIIAEGVQFSDGLCVLCWLTEVSSIGTFYNNIDILDEIHGHDGKTVIEWIDREKEAQ